MNKPTQAERERRVEIVLKLVLSSTSYRDIVRYCASEWGVQSRAVDNYIAEARAAIKVSAAQHRESIFDNHIEQLRFLMAKAFSKGDLYLVRNLLKDQAELYGLNQPQELDINLNDARTNEERANQIFGLLGLADDSEDRPRTQ